MRLYSYSAVSLVKEAETLLYLAESPPYDSDLRQVIHIIYLQNKPKKHYIVILL